MISRQEVQALTGPEKVIKPTKKPTIRVNSKGIPVGKKSKGGKGG